ILELEFSNSVVGAARSIGLSPLYGRHQCGLRARRRLAPPVQGHDTHAKCARNFALQFALRRQIICLRQLRRDFHPRVPFPFSHSSLHSTLRVVGATEQRVVPCPTMATIIALEINMKGGSVVWCVGMEYETCNITLAKCK